MEILTRLAPSYGTAVALCSAAVLSYIVLYTIYNLYFHPLAGIPGPFLAKISALPSFYHACKGDRHIWTWQNFQIYGDVFRASPNEILYNDPASFGQIYSPKANVRRSNFYPAWQRNKHEINTWNTTDNEIHAKKRRLLNLVFTDRAVRSAGVFVYKHVDRWNELMLPSDTKDWTEAMDVSGWISCLIFDVLADLCFGRSFEIKEPGENPLKIVPEAICGFMEMVNPIARSPYLNTFLKLKPLGLDKFLEATTPPQIKAYFDWIARSVTDRLALQEKQRSKLQNGEASAPVREDIFHFLAEAKHPDTGRPAYSERELRAEANLLIIAGSDTTVTALCGLFFYITQDPRVYDKLVSEIRSTFSSPADIANGPTLLNCHYLRACLDEAMRLAPSVTSDVPRTVLPGGMEINGATVPAGTTVGCSNFAMGRNETYFRDPLVFRPERWIVDDAAGVSAETVAAARSCFMPFSAGPRNCVGRNLALLEMMAVTGRTLWRMDVRRAPGSVVGQGRPELGWGRREKAVYQLNDAYTAVRRGPVLQFKKRVL